ncbi:4'-phosphopantetheinyl transferase family protein [Acinetobacter seifertii]|uniref:4'-phosphopantetheinyl transferase family protein n=1 Tax=Acinetobacter seifertii TaxID=1530123 RepID=UPI000D34835F|nr:4'-phosphopantetheinyl transferase superfamily protein [Acinetobacter seifertii]PTV49663.1 NrgA [Acinetobacter seifertii]
MSNYLYIPEQISKSIYEISSPIFLTLQLFCYGLDLSQTTHLHIDQRLDHPLKIAQARVERKNEYLCGRVLAQAVLNHHFGLDQPITSMHEPLPIWPSHVLGSISHSQNKLIVALSSHAIYLGIDIEHWVTSEFARESAHLVLTSSEFDLWKNKAAEFFDFARYVSLIFSIKESLYKAVYPTAKQYIDFLEASIVDINFENQTLTLTFLPEIQQRYQLLVQYQGGWTIEKDHIMTWVFQARNSS